VSRHPRRRRSLPALRRTNANQEYDGVDEKLPSKPFFTRWFCCMNKACKTTLVMPARYKVDLDNLVGA
jgi:hypothetical protein